MTNRLFLYRGPSKFALTGIDDEYTVECVEGDAFCFSPKTWLAVGLQVDGVTVPFASSERVVMKVCCELQKPVTAALYDPLIRAGPQVFDERDPEVGARVIFESSSMKPYKDGMHCEGRGGRRAIAPVASGHGILLQIFAPWSGARSGVTASLSSLPCLAPALPSRPCLSA